MHRAARVFVPAYQAGSVTISIRVPKTGEVFKPRFSSMNSLYQPRVPPLILLTTMSSYPYKLVIRRESPSNENKLEVAQNVHFINSPPEEHVSATVERIRLPDGATKSIEIRRVFDYEGIGSSVDENVSAVVTFCNGKPHKLSFCSARQRRRVVVQEWLPPITEDGLKKWDQIFPHVRLCN